MRELKNVTERLVVRVLKRSVTPDDLPEEILRGHRDAAQSAVTVPTGHAPSAPHHISSPVPATAVDAIWARLAAGETFWTAVYEPFKAHDITRADLRAIVDPRAQTNTRKLSQDAGAVSDAGQRLQALPRVSLPVQRQPSGPAPSGWSNPG